MRRRRTGFVAITVLGACLVTASAAAQDIAPTGSPSIVDPEMRRPWTSSRPRSFTAVTVDAGFLYLRPRVSVGYGRPHASWLGVEANPIVTFVGIGGYAGARVAFPYGDIRAGTRYFASFERSLLVPAESYDRTAIDSTVGERARLFTHETEAQFSIPAGPGDVLLLGSLSYVTHVENHFYAFEESLHVIVKPPWIWRARGGYAFHFGEHHQASLAWVVDVVGVPGRNTEVIRTGPLLSFKLSRSFELRGSFVAAVHSPDRLGLLDSDFTEFGLRWRWASGE